MRSYLYEARIPRLFTGHAGRALDFVHGLEYDEFFEDEKSNYAVIRALEVIGEAAAKIPEDMRKANPELPWREITDMRNKLMHEYFGANLEVVWKTVKEDLPVIIPILRKMLKNN
jgi:uncharacterized protein with HEPN domain